MSTLLRLVAAAAIHCILLLPATGLCHESPARSAANALPSTIPASIAVRGRLSSPPAGVSELKFGDMVKMPVGPKGLEPTERLLSLDGKRVRMVGYMVKQEVATPGMFILAHTPLALGDEDESLSDDLPATAVFVHLQGQGTSAAVPYVPGLIQLTGVLNVGAQDELDGHVSSYRLLLDAVPTKALVAMNNSTAAAPHAPARKADRKQTP